MGRPLWVQLMLGFAAVIVSCLLVVALLVDARADVTFRGYLASSQVAQSGILERLATLYRSEGDWTGAEALLQEHRGMGGSHGMGGGQGMGGQGMMRGGASLALADASGRLVADPWLLAGGPLLSNAQRAEALPIVVDGQTVGYLFVRGPQSEALPAIAQHFLDSLNSALWQAGLLAGAIGLALGLLLARGLAAPLDRLAGGAHRIAQGRLDQRVAPDGPREIAAVAAAFNEMAASLEQSEQQRRRMVADIAHELRTPLSVIQGNLRAILDDLYPLDKSEITTIYDTTRDLSRLVDDLRELSLAEAGRLDLQIRPLQLAPLVQRATALFADLAAGRQIHLTSSLPPDLPPVAADPERVTQVLNNLLSNALRYTPAGGSVSLAAAVDQQTGPDQVVISVIDSGPGIAAEDLPHVFERFWRADEARARARGGSGLGLAIARQLVRLQHGTIGVESRPGHGSRFWFTLPRASSDY